MMADPVADSPVKVIASTPGCRVRNSPAESGPEAVHEVEDSVRDAGGGHHLGQHGRRRRGLLAGLTTTALPHASAGATFQVSSSSGRFHGTTMATTPDGLRTRSSARGRRSR
jgi:hypothetical protein